MGTLKDKFLSIHRSESKTTFWGKVSVFNSVVVFGTFDVLVLIYFWFMSRLAVNLLEHSGYNGDLLFHALVSAIALSSLIPGTIIFYFAVFAHLIKFWHLCHVAGKVCGNLIFAIVRLSGTAQFGLMRDNGAIILHKFGHMSLFFLIKIIFMFITLWYLLVLERIRSVGGTGNEYLSADEIEEAKVISPPSLKVIVLDEISESI